MAGVVGDRELLARALDAAMEAEPSAVLAWIGGTRTLGYAPDERTVDVGLISIPTDADIKFRRFPVEMEDVLPIGGGTVAEYELHDALMLMQGMRAGKVGAVLAGSPDALWKGDAHAHSLLDELSQRVRRTRGYRHSIEAHVLGALSGWLSRRYTRAGFRSLACAAVYGGLLVAEFVEDDGTLDRIERETGISPLGLDGIARRLGAVGRDAGGDAGDVAGRTEACIDAVLRCAGPATAPDVSDDELLAFIDGMLAVGRDR